MIPEFEQMCRAVARAEREVRFLARCQPTNLAAEKARLRAAWIAGRAAAPALIYDPVHGLCEWRRALEALSCGVNESGLFEQLLRERARELVTEAELVELIGAPDFRIVAGRRFRAPEGEARQRCDAFVNQWAAPREPEDRREFATSDDASCPWSLVALLARGIGALRLPMSVRVVSSLMSTAATADTAVYVREGVRLTRVAALRIAVHELVAHALPRSSATRTAQPLLAVGTAGASDDEEGRALLIEERLELMDASRSAELAYRHCACQAVRDGAEWGDILGLLNARGATLDQALEIALRALRGGGLGREIVYLPRFYAVSSAFERTPELEGWFELGKVGLGAAERMERAEVSLGPTHAAARALQDDLIHLLLPERAPRVRGRMGGPSSAAPPRPRLLCSALGGSPRLAGTSRATPRERSLLP